MSGMRSIDIEMRSIFKTNNYGMGISFSPFGKVLPCIYINNFRNIFLQIANIDNQLINQISLYIRFPLKKGDMDYHDLYSSRFE